MEISWYIQSVCAILCERRNAIRRAIAQSLASKHEPITTPSPLLTALLVNSDFIVEDFDIGEDEIWPDWSSLRACHYYPKHAQVMCFVYEGGESDGERFRRCPRSRLLDITNSAKKDHDIEFMVGVEIEFCTFDDSKGAPEPLRKFIPMLAKLLFCLDPGQWERFKRLGASSDLENYQD
jgi:hypothetical protein